MLLSTAHHPGPYTGTIHGLLKQPAPVAPGVVSLETYQLVRASGAITPYGPVGVSSGLALDHGVSVGSTSPFVPVENRQSLEIGIARHGRGLIGLELVGPIVPAGTRIRPGRYSVTIYNANATRMLATETAILSIPKGLPKHTGQSTPFTLTFQAHK